MLDHHLELGFVRTVTAVLLHIPVVPIVVLVALRRLRGKKTREASCPDAMPTYLIKGGYTHPFLRRASMCCGGLGFFTPVQ